MAFILYCPHLFVPLISSKVGCISEIKINGDLFCISLDLHYLCTRNGNLARELCLMKGNQVRVLNSTCCCNPRLRGLFV